MLALPAVREAWFEQHNHVHPVADLLGTSDAAFPDGDVLIEAIRRAWFADGGGEPAPRMQVIGTPAVVHVFCTQPENEQLAATIAQFR